MSDCLIGIGANLGDRERSIGQAMQEIRSAAEISSVVVSGYHRTEPVGGPTGQEFFLNAAARFQTSLSPRQLLRFLHRIEKQLGREREDRWGPRTIDLDLLLMDDLVFKRKDLVVPHPRIAFRRFVLEPAVEIAADMVHPEMGWTLQQLFDHLNRARPYVAFTGIGVVTEKERIASLVASRLDGVLITPIPRESLRRPLDMIEADSLKNDAARVKHLAELLAPDRITEQQLCISDFWFDELVTLDRFELSDEEFAHRQQQWEAYRHQVMQPKLLVLLKLKTESPDSERIAERNEAVEKLVREAAQCPILCLDDSDPNFVIQEVVAAIDAMR